MVGFDVRKRASVFSLSPARSVRLAGFDICQVIDNDKGLRIPTSRGADIWSQNR